MTVHQQFATTDLDAAVEMFSAAFDGGGIRLDDLDDFYYSQDYLAAEGVAAVQQSMGARALSSSQESDTLFLAWTDEGRTTYRFGSHEFGADRGLLWSGRAGVEAEIDSAVVGSLTMGRDEFEIRAGRLVGQDQVRLPDYAPLVGEDGVRLARKHFSAMREVYLQPAVADSPLAWASASDLTVAVVLAVTGLEDRFAMRRALPRSVSRAVSFIDDHLDQPISMSDIAAAAGVSARGLQEAFRRATGETPMARLRRARLDGARADLLAADPSTSSVATIARRWGFAHLGRFANTYRLRFREPPGHTLRR